MKTAESIHPTPFERYVKVRPEINNEVFKRRYEQAERFVVPYLKGAGIDISKYDCLEIGCGEGAKACAFSPYFKSYCGFDIDEDSINRGKFRARQLGVTEHIDFLKLEASDLGQLIADRKFDFVFLYAVLEHLTIDERLETLSAIWNNLPENGILYIGEAPNRISPIDYHSSMLPNFQNLPIELAKKLYSGSKQKAWKERIISEDNLELGFYRNGQAVSYHEFEFSIAPMAELNMHIIADNYHVDMLNMNPLRWFELNTLEDFAGHTSDPFLQNKPVIPAAFSRYWIDFVLTKEKLPKNQQLMSPVIVRRIGAVSTSYRKDNLRNELMSLEKFGEAVRMDLPSGISKIMFSLTKDSFDGSIEIADEVGTVIYQSTMKNLQIAGENHWNKLVWNEFSITSNKYEFLNIRYLGQSDDVYIGPILAR